MTGETVLIVLWVISVVFGVVLGVLWLLLPFAVFGIRRLLGDLLEEQIGIRKRLDALAGKEVEAAGTAVMLADGQPRQTPDWMKIPAPARDAPDAPRIPSAPTVDDIEFGCPSCGKSLAVARAGAGLQVTCPECKHPIVVPDAC